MACSMRLWSLLGLGLAAVHCLDAQVCDSGSCAGLSSSDSSSLLQSRVSAPSAPGAIQSGVGPNKEKKLKRWKDMHNNLKDKIKNVLSGKPASKPGQGTGVLSSSSTSGSNSAAPQKSPSWGTDNPQGSPFDDYAYDGFSGAISKVCYSAGKANWFSVRSIVRFQVWYAGTELPLRGINDGTGGVESTTCLSLNSGEVIYKIAGRTLDRADSGVMSLYFCTMDVSTREHLRCSKNIGEDNQGGETFAWSAPTGQHIQAFYGRDSGSWSGWDGNVEKIGVYHGGEASGTAQWSAISVADNSKKGMKFETQMCTEMHTETTTEQQSEWSVAVTTEMSAGFDVPGLSDASASTSLESSYASSLMTSTTNAFTQTKCDTVTFTCPVGTRLYQWVYKTSYGNQTRAVTFSNYKSCSATKPCCLPEYFRPNASKLCCSEAGKAYPSTWTCKPGPFLCLA